MCAVCDVCRTVVHTKESNLLFHSNQVDWPGEQDLFYIACKEDCTEELDRRHGRLESIEFDMAVLHLIFNSGLKLKDLPSIKRRSEMLNSLV